MPSLLERLRAQPLLSVVLLSGVLFLSGNWILPLLDRDEPRFAEASREMLQRRDWIVPWFNGQYRFDKPPLIYWCQAAAYRLFGQNAFAARLPSVVFTTATAVLLLLWGKRLGNAQAGLYAAILLVTCLDVLMHARLAVADMPMIFFVSAAVWSGWEMSRPAAQSSGWWWIFYLSLALGFLAKGPVAWLPLAGLFAGRWVGPAEFRLPLWPTLLGVLLSLLLIGLWGVPALLATGGQFFIVGIGHHVVFRSLGIMEGHGGAGWVGYVLTLPLYLLTFFFSFFPWSFKVPAVLRAWWPSRNQDPFGCYLFTQAALVFLVFTLVRTKLPHYTLPAFPALSLWLALQVCSAPGCAQWLGRGVLAMCCLCLLITLAVFTVVRPYFVAARLYQQVRPLCSPAMQVATLDFGEPSLVWEFRRTTTNYLQHLTADQAPRFLRLEGPRMLILPTRELSAELQTAATNYLSFRARGLDTVSFRRVDLTALVRESSR